MSGGNEVDHRLRAQLAFELGPELTEVLDDPAVYELLLNADGRVWVDRAEGMSPLANFYFPPHRAESLLGTIASISNLTITADNPILETTLPYRGFRVTGIIPPVTTAPIFTIRKPPAVVFPLGTLLTDLSQLDRLREALRARQNIVVSGATGSGKTTLASSLLRELVLLCPDHRLIVLEDTPELSIVAQNFVSCATSHSVHLSRLIRTTLRLDPTRIIVGEVRGAEAFHLLKAWNTGHPGGVATVHANSASSALSRLDQLAQEANVPSQLQLVHDAVDVVVHIEPRCRITELLDRRSASRRPAP